MVSRNNWKARSERERLRSMSKSADPRLLDASWGPNKDTITMLESEWAVCQDPASMFDHLNVPYEYAGNHCVMTHHKRMMLAAAMTTWPDGRTVVDRDRYLTRVRTISWTATPRPGVHNPVQCIGELSDGCVLLCTDLSQWADIIREVMGNPWSTIHRRLSAYRPLADWLNAEDRLVYRLASTIYQTQDYSGMPILADALEDVGCDEVELIQHLRRPVTRDLPCDRLVGISHDGQHSEFPHRGKFGDQPSSAKWVCTKCKGSGVVEIKDPHRIGCWAIDLILGLNLS